MSEVDTRDQQPTGFDPVATLYQVARKFGVERIAGMLGRSVSLMYDKLGETRDNKTPTLREAYAITKASGNSLLIEEWARDMGGVFVPLPKFEGTEDDLIDDLLELSDSMGAFARKLKDARADGVITRAEFESQRRAATLIHRNIEHLMLDLQPQIRELPKPAATIPQIKRAG